MVTAERHIEQPRLRGFVEFQNLPELPKTEVLIASDVEGPMLYLDFIDEIMAERIRKMDGTHPELDEVEPPHGHVIYNLTYEVFNDETKHARRPFATGRRASLSQECEDTLHALPLLLAVGVTTHDLKIAALKSKPVEGAKELYREVQMEHQVPVFGVTSTFQDPYRLVMEKENIIPPNQLFGSPMPLEEMRIRLERAGVYDEEVYMVKEYIADCINLIDEYSDLEMDNGQVTRQISGEGKEILKDRIRKFLFEELGLTYDPVQRKQDRSISVMGQVIEEHRVLGDRSKVAITKAVSHKYLLPNGVTITQGDGLNDVPNLEAAEISIGINSRDAAMAAKIGIVTPTMKNLMPIYRMILRGERNPSVIVERANSELGSSAIVHLGGEDVDRAILEEHAKMKKAIRGVRLIY